MKPTLKIIIIVLLAGFVGRYIFNQTPRWIDYKKKQLASDSEFMKSIILDALDATGVVSTGSDIISGWSIQYSDSGDIIVDQSTLNQRLDYYKKSKAKLWK